jgi:hypothetical protein
MVVGRESLEAHALGGLRILQEAVESPGLPVQIYQGQVCSVVHLERILHIDHQVIIALVALVV